MKLTIHLYLLPRTRMWSSTCIPPILLHGAWCRVHLLLDACTCCSEWCEMQPMNRNCLCAVLFSRYFWWRDAVRPSVVTLSLNLHAIDSFRPRRDPNWRIDLENLLLGTRRGQISGSGLTDVKKLCLNNTICLTPITYAALCAVRNGICSSNTGIMDSNPTLDVDIWSMLLQCFCFGLPAGLMVHWTSFASLL